MLLVCSPMLLVSRCYSYVTRMYSCGVLVTISHHCNRNFQECLYMMRFIESRGKQKRNSSGPQGKVEAEIYFIKRVDKGRMATVKDLES